MGRPNSIVTEHKKKKINAILQSLNNEAEYEVAE